MVQKILARTLLFLLALVTAVTVAHGYHAGPAAAADGPDLIVQSIALSPENPSLGDAVTFTATLQNQGTVQAGASRVSFYVDDTLLSSKNVDVLAAGATAVATFTWTTQAGSHDIRVLADADGQVTEADETNNAKTFNLSPMAPDLLVSAITWTPDEPSRGDAITFTVSITNQGSIQSGSTTLNFYIDGSSRGLQDVYALAAGASVTRTYSWTATAGQHAIKAVIDDAGHVMEGDETNNERTVTFTTLPPDLVITGITWSPENPSKNDDVTYTVTVKNQGDGRADANHIGYYIDGVYLNSATVSTLESGASVNLTFTWPALEDEYDVRVIVDYYQKIEESEEGNNERDIAFSTLDPDLVITDLTWSPADAAVGDTVTFTATIKNQGSGRAASSRLACYISGQYTGYIDVGELAANAETTRTFTWVAVDGSHSVSMAADYDGRIGETKEDNNTMSATIALIPPDLVIQNITWAPEEAAVGDTVTFTVTVANDGGGVAENFRVAYYIDDDFQTSGYVDKIAASAAANVTFPWKLLGGAHTFKAAADYNTEIPESNEENNTRSVPVAPRMPDLLVDNIIWSPADFSAGDEVTFTVTVKNQGSERAIPSRIAYYVDGAVAGYQDLGPTDAGATVEKSFPWAALGGAHDIKIAADANNQVVESDEGNNVKTASLPPPDMVIGDITWAPADAGVGDAVTFTVHVENRGSGRAVGSQVTLVVDGKPLGQQYVAALAAGGAATATFDWVAKAGVSAVRAAADAGNLVTENDETNNEQTASFATLTPDLAIEALDWSMENPQTGGDITLKVIIKNRGSDRALASQLAAMAAGETLTETFLFNPVAGRHTVRVVADVTGQLSEIDEANNEKSLDFSTDIPDLLVQSITWSPKDAAAGDTVTFTVKITNQGREAAPEARVDLYIDGAPVDYGTLAEIKVGDTVTQSFDWTAVNGSHKVSASVDGNDLVVESNEANNEQERAWTLIASGSTAAKPIVTPLQPAEKSLLEDLWWPILGVVVLLGGIAGYAALKSSKD